MGSDQVTINSTTGDVEKEIKRLDASISHEIDLQLYKGELAESTPRERYANAMKAIRKERGTNRRGTVIGRDGRKAYSRFGEMERMTYLVRLGWQCGKRMKEVFAEAGYPEIKTARAEERKVGDLLEAVRLALVAEVANIDASTQYSEFCERARGIIHNLESQAQRIQLIWADEDRRRKDNPDYEMRLPYTKEHVVIWDRIFQIEKQILEIGLEMGVVGRKDETQTINFFAGDLLPDSHNQLLPEPKQQAQLPPAETKAITADTVKATLLLAKKKTEDTMISEEEKRQRREKAIEFNRMRRQASLIGGYDDDEG